MPGVIQVRVPRKLWQDAGKTLHNGGREGRERDAVDFVRVRTSRRANFHNKVEDIDDGKLEVQVPTGARQPLEPTAEERGR